MMLPYDSEYQSRSSSNNNSETENSNSSSSHLSSYSSNLSFNSLFVSSSSLGSFSDQSNASNSLRNSNNNEESNHCVSRMFSSNVSNSCETLISNSIAADMPCSLLSHSSAPTSSLVTMEQYRTSSSSIITSPGEYEIEYNNSSNILKSSAQSMNGSNSKIKTNLTDNILNIKSCYVNKENSFLFNSFSSNFSLTSNYSQPLSFPYHNHHWMKVPNILCVPGPRAAHSCDIIRSKLYIFGGWNGKSALNDLYILDVQRLQQLLNSSMIDSNFLNINSNVTNSDGSKIKMDLWKEIKANKYTPEERNNHTTVVVGNKLYIHGGHDGSKWLSSLYVLDTSLLNKHANDTSCDNTNHSINDNVLLKIWKKPVVNGVAPSSRACHTISRVNKKLYMFGGYDGEKCFNDINVLDTETMCWLQPKVNGTKPLARNAHTMTVLDDHLFLFGGHSGQKHLTDLHVFDTNNLTWSQPEISGTPPPGLRGHTSNLVSDKIIIFGGYDGKRRSNNIYIIDTSNMLWLHPQDCDKAPSGRQRHSASLVFNKKLYIFGGFDGTKWLNDMHILDISRIEEEKYINIAVTNLIENLRKLINNKDFSDVTLVVEGREIYAHKNILTCSCEYFRNMFNNDMKEKKQEKIVIKMWTYDAYVCMIEYLYTGNLSNKNDLYHNINVLGELLGLADHYALDNLKLLIEHILLHSVDIENVCNILKNAEIYQAAKLKKFCLRYMFKYSEYITNTEAFDELASIPSLIVEIAKMSLNNEKKKINS